MSENIIYCYSGSGHCLNMARRERFPNPNVKALDLTKKIIHID